MEKLILILLFLGLTGCERFHIGTEDPGSMSIYKTRGNYSEFLSISLTPDESKVSSFPGPSDLYTKNKPVSLANNYQTSLIGLDYVFTDIRLDDWSRIWDSIHVNNISPSTYLYDHIIDFDPFTELYVDYERIINGFPDTTFLNTIIKNNELIKYFERIK